jgi:L-iditol 2-dehydrogenase
MKLGVAYLALRPGGMPISRVRRMRTAVLSEDGYLTIRHRPQPVVRPEEMLLRTRSCGLCGSDLYKIRNRTVPAGAVLGHEIVGIVERSPSSALPYFPPGSRVTVSNHIPCGKCAACTRGRISMCPGFQATQVDPGGFAEFIRVPVTHIPDGVIPVPDNLPDEWALMAEPLGCCLRAMEHWAPPRGDSILVMGLGSVGILMVLLLAFKEVTALGVDPIVARRKMAAQKGCRRAVPPEETAGLGSVQGVILTVCTPDTLDRAIQVVEPGGWIGLFAGPRQPMSIPCDVQAAYKKEVDVIPSYSTGPEHMRKAMALLERAEIDVSGLITHVMPFEEIQTAVEMAEAQRGLKAMLRF